MIFSAGDPFLTSYQFPVQAGNLKTTVTTTGWQIRNTWTTHQPCLNGRRLERMLTSMSYYPKKLCIYLNMNRCIVLTYIYNCMIVQMYLYKKYNTYIYSSSITCIKTFLRFSYSSIIFLVIFVSRCARVILETWSISEVLPVFFGKVSVVSQISSVVECNLPSSP